MIYKGIEMVEEVPVFCFESICQVPLRLSTRALTFFIPFPSLSLLKKPIPLSEIVKVSPPALRGSDPSRGVTLIKLISALVAWACLRMLLMSSRQML